VGFELLYQGRYYWAILDLMMGWKFKLGRNYLAGLILSRASPNLTKFGEIWAIWAESQNRGSHALGSGPTSETGMYGNVKQTAKLPHNFPQPVSIVASSNQQINH
jgi:hypothetical protein